MDEADEKIQLDFSDVFAMSPSWASEFILALQKEYVGRVELLPTDNASVVMTMQFLDKIKGA